MNMQRTFRHIILAFMAMTSFSLLGCGGCASQDTTATNEREIRERSVFSYASEKSSKPEKVVVWRLGTKASSIYAYLVFEDAVRHDDAKGIVTALTELSRYDAPESAYIDAGIWFLDNDPLPILPIFEKGLQKYPSSTSLHLLYAELLQKAGEGSKAIVHMRGFIQRAPENIDAKLELALLLVQADQYDEAESILQNISKKDRTPLVEYYHAKALVGMQKLKEALPYLQKAHKQMPDFLDVLVDLAFVYEKLGELKKAKDTYEKILLLSQGNLDVVVRIVNLSLRLKDVEDALAYYEDYAENPLFSATVGSLFVETGYYDEAESILKRLVDVKDAPQEIYFYLAAIAYERDKNLLETTQWLEKISSDSNAYPRSVLLRMELCLEQGKMEEALALAREGKDVAANAVEFWMMEVRILLHLKEMKGALESVSVLLEKWPDNTGAAYLKASILEENGQRQEAVTLMEAIILREPNHYQALNYVGYTLVEENRDLDRALQLIERAVRLSPDSDYIQDSLAWVLFKRGDVAGAWRVISAVIHNNIHEDIDPTIWEHYGEIARALGKKEEARIGYEKALEYGSENAENIQERLTGL